MDAKEAVRRMVEASGRSASDVSRSIGKSRNYIGVLIAQGSDPRTRNLARIAHECGYRLVLRNDETNDELELYDERDADDLARDLVSKLPTSVKLGDLVKALEDASYSEERPAKVGGAVTTEDLSGGVFTAEPSMSAKDLEYLGGLIAGDGDASKLDVRVLKEKPKEDGSASPGEGGQSGISRGNPPDH